MTRTPHFFNIHQPPGCVTIMDGIAGRGFKHCVRPDPERHFSVSLIFRKVILDEEDNKTKNNNNMERNESDNIPNNDNSMSIIF